MLKAAPTNSFFVLPTMVQVRQNGRPLPMRTYNNTTFPCSRSIFSLYKPSPRLVEIQLGSFSFIVLKLSPYDTVEENRKSNDCWSVQNSQNHLSPLFIDHHPPSIADPHPSPPSIHHRKPTMSALSRMSNRALCYNLEAWPVQSRQAWSKPAKRSAQG